MQQSILTKIKLFILRNRQNRIFRKCVRVLCCMVVFVTTYALILPAITMEQDAFCGKEAHEHTEECLQPVSVPVLVCTPESLGIHTHSGSCYNADGAVICGQADYVVHSHSGSCYDAAGQLVCLLPERSSHVHGESCYIPGETQPEILHVHSEACYIQEQGELTCTEEEREGHSHDDQCYGPGELLECSLTENHVHDASCYSLPLTCSLSTEPHVHSDACYGTGNLQCTTPEYHTHTDSCWDRTLSCGKSEGGHQHSGSCWETVQVCQNTEETHEHGEGCTESRLICGLTEESHYHDESCYTSNLRCQIPENHAHSSSCYESILVCGKEAGQAHEHNDSCYGTEPQLQCRMPENHVHDSGCYNRILNCEVPEDPGHRHEDACYQWDSVLNCGLEEGQPEPTEPPEPVLACTEPEAPVHVHGDSCFELQEKTCQGGEDHQHTDSCYTCGLEAHAHTLICYSDPDADVESPEVWKATFAHVTLTGDWPTDVVAIAETQLGYTESTRNYDVWEDNSIHGYTRYGAWYGAPHGDWCGMFASFCLNYAEVKGMPHNYGVRPWIEELTKLGLYYTAKETKAQKGNLIFFDWDADGLSDHVGIVAEVQEPQEHSGASVKTIEGNSGNAVRYQHYDPNDPVILGYGLLPGQERIPVTTVEPDDVPSSLQAILICGMPAHTHGEICYRADGECICSLEEHIHTIDCVDSSIPVGYADGGAKLRMMNTKQAEGSIEYYSNLYQLLQSVAIYDSQNNLVYETSNPNGSGTVTIGENCLIEVTFAENESTQFSTEGQLFYQFPDNLSAVLVGTGVIRNRNNSIIATYEIINNKLIITPVLVEGQNFFGAYNNVSLKINFKAEVIQSEDSSQTIIDFKDNIQITVNVEENTKLDAFKQELEYDPETQTIRYQGIVTAYGGMVPITTISDWWAPKNASLVDGSLQLKDQDGNLYDMNDWNISYTENMFELHPKNPINLNHKEFITLTYELKIHDNVYENFNLDNTLYTYSKNNGNPLEDQDTITTPVVVTNISKSGVQEKEAVGDTYLDVLKWTVNIDNPSMDTIKITDQLGRGQTFCTHKPIIVNAMRPNGTYDTITVAWDAVTRNDANNRFEYTLPTLIFADNKNEYKAYELVYYSHYEFDENTDFQTFDNTVTTDVHIGNRPTVGTGTVGAIGVPYGISKTAESKDFDWITFTIDCTMPGILNNQPNVLLYDSLGSWGNENYFIDLDPDSLRVTVTPDGGTSYDLQPYTGQASVENTYLLEKNGPEFTMYFNTSQPDPAASVWKCPDNATLTISYRVSRDSQMLYPETYEETGETLEEFLERTNQSINNFAKVDYAPGFSSEANVEHTPPSKIESPLTKTAEVATDAKGNKMDGVYKYTVLMDTSSGIFNTLDNGLDNAWHYDIESLLFTDKFDSRMLYIHNSGSFSVKAWDVWDNSVEFEFAEGKQPTISGNTMSVNADDLIVSTNNYLKGQTLRQVLHEFTGGRVEFTYLLSIDPEIKNNATDGVLLLDNEATIEWTDRFGNQGPIKATNQVEYDTGVLQKGMHVVDDSNVVEFSILVNHKAVDLAADGDTYILYDTMSSNLILLYDTLKVEIVEDAPGQNRELSLAECKFEYDADRNRMTFVVPDNNVIRLTYRCRVDGLGGTSTDISNHVELLGRSTVQDVVDSKFEIKSHEGSADATSEAFYLRKQDGNNHNVLAGVTFNLYGDVPPDGYKGDPAFTIDHTVHSHQMYLLGSYTTGEDGVVHIAHTQLTKKHLYALEEVSPPDGYIALPERYLFYVEERKPESLQEIPCIINNQLVVIENFPEASYELPSTGGTGKELYTVGGTLLMLAAVILLYNQKKCRKEDIYSS